MEKHKLLLNQVLSYFFFIYRGTLSPLICLVFNVHCRYEETCSCYMERSIQEHGLSRGLKKGFLRFLSCNQFVSFRSLKNG